MFRHAYPVAWAFHRHTTLERHALGEPHPTPPVAPFKEYLTAPLRPLPTPHRLRRALGAVIRARLSCRRFGNPAVPLRTLATLLHASYGLQEAVPLGDGEMLTRPVPSGGGLYPLEVYLLVRRVQGLAPGIYHYAVLPHALEQLETPVPAPPALAMMFLGQPYVAEAAVVVVLTAVLARSCRKYADRGYRLILLEAGHTMQNLNLASTALGWGSVNLGGFFDGDLSSVLQLDPEQEVPLYATAIGKPLAGSAAELR